MSTKQTDKKILLPFIIRGQEINSDELLYQSRDGKVQFHYPDPRPLLNQIIMPDPTQLQRDFAKVSVNEIIRFLSEAGKAMTLNNARMQKACQFSMPFSSTTAFHCEGQLRADPDCLFKDGTSHYG